MGRNRFLNDLFAKFLLHEESISCQEFGDDADLSLETNDLASYCVHLIDAHNLVLDEQWDAICDCSARSASQCYYALFNIDPGAGIEVEAMRKGVRGIFYGNDSLEMVCKGVGKIILGEVWFSRDTLLNCIIQQSHQSANKRINETDEQVKLTFREQEILNYLGEGATNQEIADKMVVSVHTVKSHLYNLYKKINVPNRLQAMLWASGKQILGIIVAVQIYCAVIADCSIFNYL